MIGGRYLIFGGLAAAELLAQTGADDKDKEKKKEEQGLQYRAIGPFRGGRSLTASGIAGDPTTYYFGSTRRRHLEIHRWRGHLEAHLRSRKVFLHRQPGRRAIRS